MKGKKPIPSKIIDIMGGSKHTHRPPRSNEPKPPTNIPPCPKHLDKEARQEWKRMAAELEPLGILTNLDKAVFANYCDAYSQWAQASRTLQKSGLLIKGPLGNPVVNPLFRIVTIAKDQMMRCLIEMGMTPSSRTKVKVEKPTPIEKDRKERFFN